MCADSVLIAFFVIEEEEGGEEEVDHDSPRHFRIGEYRVYRAEC